MENAAIIGAQWGDEGKGKITDSLAKQYDFVVRFQGGNNAGHTIYVDGKKTVLHIIPSGVLSPGTISIIGHGTVFSPTSFLSELEELMNNGVSIGPENLKVSGHANVITRYHEILDACREGKNELNIGTTKKGIGPSYEDKFSRRGLKTEDLLDKEKLRGKLSVLLSEKAVLFEQLYQSDFPSIDEEVERLASLGQKIAPYITDTVEMLYQAEKQNKSILFEGAQGVLLDIDYGSYPFVTSSHTGLAGVFTGSGFPQKEIKRVIGIVKAYTTRVGSGPFPTEIFGEEAELIQDKGQEFGATTGRRRRCGWTDLPLLRYAIHFSQLTEIALTKVDILQHFKQYKVCVGYRYKGKNIDMPFPGMNLEHVEPIYEQWDLPETIVDDNNQLTKNMQAFKQQLEKNLNIPITFVAYGPDRKQLWEQ
jgi:adenylosuccinate synthase